MFMPSFHPSYALASEMPDYFGEHPNLYKIGPGRIVEFIEDSVTPCTNPNIQIHDADLLEDPVINPENIDDHFFVVLNEFTSDSYRYLKIALPEGDGYNKYYSMLYNQDGVYITGHHVGLESGSSQFVLETASGDLIMDEDRRFDEFVETGKTKFGSYSYVAKPGTYVVHSVLSQHAGTSIDGIPCVIAFDWEFSVNDNGAFSTNPPQVKTGTLVNVTAQFPIKQQIQFGFEPWMIVCKEGKSVLSQKEYFFHDARIACVTPETKTKLVERGWTLAAPTSELTFFDKSKELETGKTFENFMKKQSYNNVPESFVIGKHNFKNDGTITYFCGEFKDITVNYQQYFHGAIDNSGTLVWDGLEKQSAWCAINDDAKKFSFTYDWKLVNEN